ncbi:hypothetical protein BJ166DRAFT_54784 [Pestalotiopsis sp. NC0098]|nr:hypothetical protein BJ166DRAFT_54784 [Pestalotiopsis sp. NC0098]
MVAWTVGLFLLPPAIPTAARNLANLSYQIKWPAICVYKRPRTAFCSTRAISSAPTASVTSLASWLRSMASQADGSHNRGFVERRSYGLEDTACVQWQLKFHPGPAEDLAIPQASATTWNGLTHHDFDTEVCHYSETRPLSQIPAVLSEALLRTRPCRAAFSAVCPLASY